MNKEYFAIWDTENKRFVTSEEAVDAGADANTDSVSNPHYLDLFHSDTDELVYIIHDAGKTGEWEVIPVTVDIKISIAKK